MSNFIAMYQYTDNTFSVIHHPNLKPEPEDKAIIVEVTETKPHKTDPNSLISIVKCAHQQTSKERGVVL